VGTRTTVRAWPLDHRRGERRGGCGASDRRLLGPLV